MIPDEQHSRTPQTPLASQNLLAAKVDEAPVIDGNEADAAWTKAQAIVTHDKVADIDITLKAVHHAKHIFFLVRFPDPDESRIHKSWIWDKSTELYKMGPDREDVFVIKWSMETHPVDLSIYADHSHSADIWFWKACRTDPIGYADDKIHTLSLTRLTRYSTILTTKPGSTTYLLRAGDNGQPSYKTNLIIEYQGDVVPRFVHQVPKGSRADVKAKGMWNDGWWTIEFARALNTGFEDDIQFDLTKRYWFGVSRYEVAGKPANPKISQPLYGSGDISEVIILSFAK